ncbi:hypothetical protein [Exiguobacterium algae]|uniref:hypothetical protein n=1 Tax=Exiguobacterium algae TaxID=2751250 RepID=UPI001BE5E24B|nr:hypothetical protein [Exiguobacterium algae]
MFKRGLLLFVGVYLLVTICVMFTGGVVIDWVPEATLFQKIQQYTMLGLAQYPVMKLVITVLITGSILLYVEMRKNKRGKEDL